MITVRAVSGAHSFLSSANGAPEPKPFRWLPRCQTTESFFQPLSTNSMRPHGAGSFPATPAEPPLPLLSPNIVLGPSGVGTSNITRPQGGDDIRVYFRIRFDKRPSALTATAGYLCEVADCRQGLCFSVLQGKGRKITFFPGRNG